MKENKDFFSIKDLNTAMGEKPNFTFKIGDLEFTKEGLVKKNKLGCTFRMKKINHKKPS